MADEAQAERRRGDRRGRHGRAADRAQQRGVRRRRAGPLRRPGRGHLRRGGGPARLPRGEVGARARARLARRVRHRRRQLAVHVRSRRARRRALQRQRRRGALHGAVSASTASSPRTCWPTALDAIAADLARLDGRPTPDTLVGMGGAVTNLAAVKHELATYDPDVVQGTVLDRAEIDRQIELYRTRTGEERRQIVGAAAEARRGHPRRRVHRADRRREARPGLAHRERPRPAARPARRAVPAAGVCAVVRGEVAARPGGGHVPPLGVGGSAKRREVCWRSAVAEPLEGEAATERSSSSARSVSAPGSRTPRHRPRGRLADLVGERELEAERDQALLRPEQAANTAGALGGAPPAAWGARVIASMRAGDELTGDVVVNEAASHRPECTIGARRTCAS